MRRRRSRSLVVARARAQAGVLATAAALLLAAASAVTGVLAFGEAQTTSGLRQALAAVPPSDAVATISARRDEDPVAQHAAVTEQVAALVDDAPAVLSRSLRSSLLDVVEPVSDARVVAVAYDDLAAIAEVTDGAWPASDGEAALHKAAADILGVVDGDRIVVEGADAPVTLTVTGTYRPLDPSDPALGGDPLEVQGSESPTVVGPLVVPDVLAAGLDERPAVRWRLSVDAARAEPADLAGLASAAQRLRGQVTGDPRVGADVQVSEELSAALTGLAQRVVVARSISALPAVVVSAMAGTALLLVARLLVDVRAGETRLVRARGASGRQVAAWATLEGLALAVPVAVVAAPAGWLLARAAGGPAVLAPRLWVSGALVTLAGAVLLLAPPLRAARDWSVVAPGRSSRQQLLRRGLDVVLVVAAAVAVLQLRRYGSAVAGTPTGAGLAVDPLLVAAPALGLLAGAVVAARLLPVAAGAVQRLLARRRGLAGALTAWEVARRPAAHGASLLLVALAVGAGTFAAGYTASWRDLQDDAATLRTGADVRVVAPQTGSTLPGTARIDAYAALDGVHEVTPVGTSPADASSADLTVIAVDTGSAAATLALPAGPGPDAAELVGQVAPTDASWPGVALPEGTDRIEVDLALSQSGFDATGFFGEQPQVAVTLWFGAATGEVVAEPLGVVLLPDPAPRAVTKQVDLPGAGPWTLVAADVEVPSVPVQQVTHDVAVAAVRAVPEAGRAIEPVDAGSTGWHELDTAVPVSVAPPTVGVGGNGWPRMSVATAGAGPPGQLRVRAGATGLAAAPAAAVVTRGMAAAGGIAVGDVVTVQRQGIATSLAVVAVADRLPGTTGDAALVDLRSLSAGDLARGAVPAPADEWWLATADGSAEAVAAGVGEVPGAPAEVLVRDRLAERLADDPLAGASLGAFDLALLAAVGLVGAGLAVAAAATARHRRVETAVLRALGGTAGQIRRLLAVEQLTVALLAALVGAAVGIAVSWLTLPHLVGTAEGSPLLAETRFSAARAATVLVAVLVAAALAVIGRLVAARRRAPAADVRPGWGHAPLAGDDA